MSKSNVVKQKYGVQQFDKWWATLQDTDQVRERYPHAQHKLAFKPSNSEKPSVKNDFWKFIDENSQPTCRNTGSFGAQYYFSPK